MSASLELAGDAGERRITVHELFHMPAYIAEDLQAYLVSQARLRGLEVQILSERPSGDIIVRWRPDRHADRSAAH